MKSVDRPLRVFLCHSSNDKPAVRELYQKLRAEAWIEPWLDEEELYPGQDWNLEIEKAVEAADAIIVCLTKGSITKEGYVQRELRIVLDFADYKPEGTLYIMPVRLEECVPPRRLRPWQYADYFEGQRERGLQRLLVSLKRRADSLELEYEETNKREAKEEVNRLAAQKAEEERVAQVKIESERKSKEDADRLAAQKVEEERVALAKIESKRKAKEEADRLAAQKVEEERVAQAKIESERKAKEESESEAGDRSREVVTPKIIASTSNKITLSNGMEFMRVPAGKFLMGSTKENKSAYDDERPQHTVDILYDYWMARYPVTNELYNVYVKFKGIKHPVDGWEKKKDHPVVYVSRNDAMEYCKWLNQILHASREIPIPNLQLRLPTEAEWEKAARGTGGFEYPWGNQFDKNKCNTDEGEKGDTTPVSLYSPQGDSPYGCADMSGNVWEWTHSLFKSYPYKVNDGREDERASGARVLRGGSFIFNLRYARCACRNYVDLLNNDGSFRVVASPVLS